MKKKSLKLTAIILLSTALFGCAHTDRSLPTSSVESDLVSSEASNESQVSESSDASSEQLWLEAPEGSHVITYNRKDYTIVNEKVNSETPSLLHSPSFILFEEYIDDRKPMQFVKVKVAGESIYMENKANTPISEQSFSFVCTPVIIEEIVDSRGNESEYKENDIIYIYEYYTPITEHRISMIEDLIKRYEEDGISEGVWGDLRQELEYMKQYKDNNNLLVSYCYPMEKDASYLVLVGGESDYTIQGDYKLYLNAEYIMDLSAEAPVSYGNTDKHVFFYQLYELYWKDCKELYGSYFE